MSLDVNLTTVKPSCKHCNRSEERNEVFSSNITHNLNKMAEAANIYYHLWRPEEIGITKASELIEPLQKGLKLLKCTPSIYRCYDSPNGWGIYDDFVPWVEEYLQACIDYPDAEVSVSR